MMVEYVLKITSCSPISLAKETTSSMAFTSAFRGPGERGKRLLKAAITDPS